MDPLYAYSGMIIYYTMKRCVLVCSFHIVRRIQMKRRIPSTIHIQSISFLQYHRVLHSDF